ncbi:phosphoglycerate dehydrogenase-like oxidoreductase [Saccharomonospora marina XMU15]|uniref:Phosphoglycerate dehydrogenase-like oxidoreductase n=1 Tax=Saccharomonospora marina XMU15 TaxID=882083 RepID=H5WZG0_9PSEU|nr:2-hydroxyacid dehydrogenase [Saccharomonospora marina]EHR49622.1 phosphoglycerate dehydrogenase-like oxidoreductase [Saccharomonospora marina XMU15]
MSARAILAAGDDFVLTRLFAEQLREQVGGQRQVRELTLPWPARPFGTVGEVREASGDEDELIAALSGADIAVTHLAPFTEKVFANAPDLRLLVVSRGGPVNVNLDAATRHGVVVCYAPGRNADAVAEFTVGLLIATCRNLAAGHAELAQGRWGGHYYEYRHAGFEIGGSTVGLVGYGAIGSRVARLLAAFGAKVLAYDPYVGEDDVEPGITRLTDLAELLRQSRVVSLHQRVTAQTRGMIGAAELALLPPGAVLINTARGAVLDYDALCDALDSGHLAAAGLDVYPDEPLPERARLLSTPNVVLSPHVAGCSREVAQRAARICAAEVGRWTRGEPVAHCANPAVLAGT